MPKRSKSIKYPGSNISKTEKAQNASESLKRNKIPACNKSLIANKSSGSSKSLKDGKSSGSSKSLKDDKSSGSSKSLKDDKSSGSSKSLKDDKSSGSSKSLKDDKSSGSSKSQKSNFENYSPKSDKLVELSMQDHNYSDCSKAVRPKIPLNIEFSNISQSDAYPTKSGNIESSIDSKKSADKLSSFTLKRKSITLQEKLLSTESLESQFSRDSCNSSYQTCSSEFIMSSANIPHSRNFNLCADSATITSDSQYDDDKSPFYRKSSKDFSEIDFPELFKKFENLKVTEDQQNKVEEKISQELITCVEISKRINKNASTSMFPSSADSKLLLSPHRPRVTEVPHQATSSEVLYQAMATLLKAHQGTAIEPRRVIRARRPRLRDRSSINDIITPVSHQTMTVEAAHQNTVADVSSEIKEENV